MSAEFGTDKTVRRERIVMALGIAAIILFSANLFTMIARHVWPDFRFESLFAGGCQLAVTEVEAVEAATDDHTVHVFVNRWKHHDGQENVEADLRAEMDRLSRDIARQQRRLDVDMNNRQDARMRTLRRARIRALTQAQAHSQADEAAAVQLVERELESAVSLMKRAPDVRETDSDGSKN